ncbi:hypothetical protein ACHAXN_011472 [Cyclotella atomus]
MCSNVPPSLIVEQSSMSSTGSEEKESGVSPPRPPSTPTNQRRAIFDNFWKKSSSIRDDNDSVTDTPTRRSGCTKVEPSYLGIYSFAPPSPLTPKPGLVSAMSPSSDDSLTPSPTRPKSILRRHHSARLRMVHPIEEEAPAEGKSRRLSLCSSSEIKPRDPMLKLPFAELPFAPQLYEGDTDSTSKDSSSMRCHGVHFDPTITVREIIGQKKDQDPHSNWFNEDELQSFFRDAIHLCHASAINSIKTFSPPEVAKAHAKAEQIGIKDPVVCSSLPEARALFAEPILHVTDEDAIVHDRSATFFKIAYKMVRRVLIVDSSQATIELMRENILSMFPHVAVDLALTSEDALNRMSVDSSGAIASHEYDIVVVDEHCYNYLEGSEHKEDEDSEHQVSMTGSQLLKLINDSESNHSSQTESNHSSQNSQEHKSDMKQRRSLMIGVSTELSEDCESLRRGGADLLWSKPPPKPSNCLRNQLLNTLLSKRGKSVFICGC